MSNHHHSSQEKLLGILAWMSTAEEKFDDLGPIAGDLNSIKDQMDHLKDFKNEVSESTRAVSFLIAFSYAHRSD